MPIVNGVGSPVTLTLPHPGTIINKPILDLLVTRGFFSGIKPYASLVAYSEEGGTGIPGHHNKEQSSAIPKYFDSIADHGIFIDGSLAIDGPYSSAFSDETFRLYGSRVAEFYRARVIAKDPAFMVNGVFTIPRLVVRPIPDHRKLNFDLDEGKDAAALRLGREVTTAEQPWSFGFLLPDPVGSYDKDGMKFSPTFPRPYGLKYEGGRPVAFHYQEYEQAHPLTTTVSVGGGAPAGTPMVKAGQEEAFLMAAGAAYFSPDKKSAAANILKQYVEVK